MLRTDSHPTNLGLQRRRNKALLGLFFGIFALAQFRAEFKLQQSLGGSEESLLLLHEGAPDHPTPPLSRSLQATTTTSTTTTRNSQLVIDILSIGSQDRPELLHTQQHTFGSHVSVRHFFNATEADDDDPHCTSHLTPDDTYQISRFCKQRTWDPQTHRLMRFLKNAYANVAWLKKKVNPVGWMCAQRRPLNGLAKVFRHYKSTGEDLPHYLIVMDDDTYFNLEQFPQLVPPQDSDDPAVFAGCLVRVPVMTVNFTFGFGGYGTIFNQASLQRLLEPMDCSHDNHNHNHNHNNDACHQLDRNLIGERTVFSNGMSVLDLIQAYVHHEPYKDHATNWTHGYCLHSDWTLGFFINHYNLSSHVKAPYYRDVPQARMEEWHGSVIYKKGEGFCRNENVHTCRPDSVTCHYMTPAAMINYTNIVKAKAPAGRFREYDTSSVGASGDLEELVS